MGKGISKAKGDDLEDIPVSVGLQDNEGAYEYEKLFLGKAEPPTPLPSSSKKKASEMTFDIIGDVPNDIQLNYDIIPMNVIHKILLCCDLCEVLSVGLSCRLFQSVSKTSLFWKEYYHSFFMVKKMEKPNELNLNWKKQFYKRLSERSDYYYRQRYKIVQSEEIDAVKEPDSSSLIANNIFNIGEMLIVGSVGVGKTSFVRRLLQNSFEKDVEPTVVDDYSIGFSYQTRRNTTAYLESQIVEVGGDDKFAGYIVNQMKKCSGLFICFSFDDQESLEFAKELTIMHIMEGRSVTSIVLLGFKSDLVAKEEEKKTQVKASKIQEFVREQGILHYIEVSNKYKENIIMAIGTMIDSIIARMKLAPEADDNVCV